MGFLDDMLGKAQGFLDFAANRAPKFTDAVKHDRFDAAIYYELLDEAPALKNMVDDLGQFYDYTEDMVRDVLMEFWQADPLLRKHEDMDPTRLQNHAVADHIAKAPDTTATRAYTKHDKYSSAMATIAVTEKIKAFLASQDPEVQQALEELRQAMEDALKKARKVRDLNGQAPPDEYDGEGPPTEEQAAWMEAMEQAQQEAAEAAEKFAEALEKGEQKARDAKQGSKQAVQQAISEVKEQLEEEAELFRAWGVDPGQVQKMSFEERAQLAKRLKQNRLNEFRKLIGRFRMHEKAERAHKVEYARDEVYSVEMSDRIPDFLGHEWAHMVNKHTRLDFLRRMSEGQILSKAYRGTEKVGQGAIIYCCDNSGSMSYTDRNGISREAYAKAMGLALYDRARASKRDYVQINFSSRGQVSVYRFPGGQGPIERVLEMTEHFFNGGTDFMGPMDLATDILEQEFNDAGKQKGDIVFATDDECGVTPAWMSAFNARKARLGFRVFGVAIGTGYGQALAGFSDNVRSITEFVDPDGISDMLKVI